MGCLLSMLVQLCLRDRRVHWSQDLRTGDDLSGGRYETTARALAWAFYLLDRNPEEGRKLREELERVLDGRTPAYEDLPRLVYTKMFVQESMRLYPPVWGLARRAKGEDEIGGHRVSKGSRLIISSYVTHRHPAFWENPRVRPRKLHPREIRGSPAYAIPSWWPRRQRRQLRTMEPPS